MPSYIYRRQLAPSQTRESLEEVRARLIEELRLRTEERVNHWNQLGDWCRQRPGRYIGVDWKSDLRSSSSSTGVEATAEAIVAGVEDSISSSSSATGTTNDLRQGRSGVGAEELNFESSPELQHFSDVQQGLQDLAEIGESKGKSVVEGPN
jgi:hypothetical protein